MTEKKQLSKSMGKGARTFYIVMFALPLLQFLIFYVAVNFNSILLAFKSIYKVNENGHIYYVTKFVGFDTFKKFIVTELNSQLYQVAIKNSLIYLAFSIVIVIPLGLIFSFYVYKKMPCSGLFRTFLFMPSVICSLVLVIFYQYMSDFCIPEMFGVQALLSTKKTAFAAIVFFNFWFSFGPASLVYVNAMTQIEPSSIEAAELDGAVGIKQFWYIVLPAIFSSISSYIIICIAQIATNQLSGYSFFREAADNYGVQTIGYNLFVLASTGELEKYPTAAAGGVLFTLIIAPLTMIIRTLLNKFGPSEE